MIDDRYRLDCKFFYSFLISIFIWSWCLLLLLLLLISALVWVWWSSLNVGGGGGNCGAKAAAKYLLYCCITDNWLRWFSGSMIDGWDWDWVDWFVVRFVDLARPKWCPCSCFMTRPDMESLLLVVLFDIVLLDDDDDVLADVGVVPLPQFIECLLSSDIRENVLAHFRHLYFLTSEWVCMWARRLDL